MLTQTVRIELRRPHPVQARIRAEARRFNVLSCGRRFGKTDLFIGLMVETALAGHPVGYFAPVYKYVTEVWGELCRILAPVIVKRNFTEKRIELLTGGVIEMWTMDDPDAGRSRRYKRVVIDEAGLQSNLMTIWTAAIRPTLMDLGGDAYIGGTPKGMNDFYKMFQRAETDPAWARFNFATTDNPHIPPQEIADYATEMGGVDTAQYRQEVLGLFVESGASYFGDTSHCYTAPDKPQPAGGKAYYVAGLDWGQQTDFTVVVILNATTGEMVDMLRTRHASWAVMLAEVCAMFKRWDVQLAIAEANAAGAIIEMLRGEIDKARLYTTIQSFTMTASSKPPLMQTLKMALHDRTLKLQDDPTIRHELNAAQAVIKNGVWSVESPRDEHGHGDTVVALALAWRACGFVV